MNRILRFASLLLLVPWLLAQSGAEPRTKGTIFKNEVDKLISALRGVSRATRNGVLGSDAKEGAQILVAMAHCHRHYHASDGPVVRPTLAALLRARGADGSFGEPASTVWVVQAFQAMDAEGYREEVARAQAWLGQQAPAGDGFAGQVQAVLGQLRLDYFPQHIGQPAADRAAELKVSPDGAWSDSGPTQAEAAAALLTLVACQVANRQLDQGKAEQVVEWDAAQEQGFQWLLSQQQEGRFGVQRGEQFITDPALTAFGLLGLQTKPADKRSAAEQECLTKGLRWLLNAQNEDGTFGDQVLNYTTCVAVGALARWGDPATLPALQRAQKAILLFQNVESGGYQRSDRDYGSVGYGNSQRGDLSNLQFSIEALRNSGLPSDHEALQKALVFLQRTQNLKSVNDFHGKVPDPERDGVILDATSGDDGGASYYPGNSNAGYITLPNGKSVPRSYGSMTYALLKSYTLAGLKGDDPRVQAAIEWVRRNWTLALNPGADPTMGEKAQYQGLYYYYMVLAQALRAAQVTTIQPTAAEGQPAPAAIDWRQALRAHLASQQQKNGAWVNGKNGRWMEGMELLCTCYALVALDATR